MQKHRQIVSHTTRSGFTLYNKVLDKAEAWRYDLIQNE